MHPIVESFNAVTAEWLQEVLQTPTTISSCRVSRSWETPVTQVALINISYKAEDAKSPQSVFLKIAKKAQHEEARQMCGREALFYSQIASLIEPTCIPRCHYAARDARSGSFNVVLEDLSSSHFQTEYPLPPRLSFCEMAVDCLAKVHASWWNRQGPEEVLGTYPPRQAYAEWAAGLRKGWSAFSLFLEDRLSSSRRLLIDRITDNIDHALDRCLDSNNLTLIHRDTHLWNFFFPRSDGDGVKLFDWQSFGYGLGVEDLVQMIAVNWYPERRKRFEWALLRRYHAALANSGVVGYSWEQLWTDYRWSVVGALAMPIWQWAHGIEASIWFNNLEKILKTFEDLNCQELLR